MVIQNVEFEEQLFRMWRYQLIVIIMKIDIQICWIKIFFVEVVVFVFNDGVCVILILSEVVGVGVIFLSGIINGVVKDVDGVLVNGLVVLILVRIIVFLVVLGSKD